MLIAGELASHLMFRSQQHSLRFLKPGQSPSALDIIIVKSEKGENLLRRKS